jgi:hypothetical protein
LHFVLICFICLREYLFVFYFYCPVVLGKVIACDMLIIDFCLLLKKSSYFQIFFYDILAILENGFPHFVKFVDFAFENFMGFNDCFLHVFRLLSIIQTPNIVIYFISDKHNQRLEIFPQFPISIVRFLIFFLFLVFVFEIGGVSRLFHLLILFIFAMSLKIEQLLR